MQRDSVSALPESCRSNVAETVSWLAVMEDLF
jgi:hypothetical protein